MKFSHNFLIRIVGGCMLLIGFALAYFLDRGDLQANWVSRFCSIFLPVIGGSMLVFGKLNLRQDKTEGTFPFWSKK